MPENTEIYFKLNLAIPFADHMASELCERFQKPDRVGASLCSLLPGIITKLDNDGITQLIKDMEFWKDDLPSHSSLRHEVLAWKRKWDVFEVLFQRI